MDGKIHTMGARFTRALTACAAGFACVLSAAPPSTAGTLSPRAVTGGSPAYNWATFHLGPRLQGDTSNSPLSTANAAQLGVAWATNLYGAALDSPVVYYDSAIGKTLAYVGTEHGDLIAIDVSTGQILWATWIGSPIRSTPVAINGAVYAGTYDSPRIYKLNASTGAIDCSVAAPSEIEGSPVAATPPRGAATVYFNTNDTASASGPLLAVKASDCSIEWSFTGYRSKTGAWDPISYAVDANGTPLVLFGTSDPDSTVYAVNALTGTEIWHFAAYNPPPGGDDVGAGVTLSPPNVNGFAGGVAYVPTKYGIVYALDLTTGAQIWSYNYNKALHLGYGGISTAALDGTSLVLGYAKGLLDVDAVTGTKVWNAPDASATQVISSPAIAGAPRSQIVAYGNLTGRFSVDSLATGAELYHYQTGEYISASPAVTDGNILIASADGFLYDFAVNGGNDATLPGTAITSPADSSTVPYPTGGNLTVTGSATDHAGVAGVTVAVQAGGANGPWWDAATNRWSSGPVGNPAHLGSPGGTSSNWTFSYPAAAAGGTYKVTAYTLSTAGQSDITAPQVGFRVTASSNSPHITAAPVFAAPGGSLRVTGGGFSASEGVAISLSGTTLTTTAATSTGSLPTTTISIPTTAPFGQATLAATGESSGRTATAAITVANNWAQLGYSATHPNFEPNDWTFYNTITPGGGIFAYLAWLYQSGAPVNTAPAVADGVAYTANAAGQLAALNVHNGAPLWTWTIPSNAALDGSPAIDPGAGLVFVGANDGTLNAISTSTGQLAWSDSIDSTSGANVSAPVYGSGDVYVTTSTGKVEAIDEATGQTVWGPVSLPDAVTAAPTLDTASKTLIVPESNGDVVALSSATGTALWQQPYHGGGAISAPATIYKGIVYFGSGDSVDAISEANGTGLWSYQTGGTVADTPTITNSVTAGQLLLMVGSDDGLLYALQAGDGALAWDLNTGSPIAGVATVASVVVYDTTTGMVGTSRTYAALPLWKYTTKAGITAPPVIVNGTIYIGARDWNLYSFTSYGKQPAAAPRA
jgi:outer membrane protein assembly factor BamB